MTDLVIGGQIFRIEEIQQEATVQTILVNGRQVTVELLKEVGRDPLELLVKVENRVFRLVVERDSESVIPIILNGRQLEAILGIGEGAGRSRQVQEVDGPIVIFAPMSGRIASIKIDVGGRADEGQSLVILEAMKMENEIACPKRGIVREVYVHVGDLVKAGDKLALVE